ncbi:MarR family transcriptional regulator [Actinocatenispora thailandica]|uniref:MarR family transcriptional regulator n=1 Tax=Actinocatenispora thailandica TaxID=227318 RepID=A0A7R7DU10_9ACTN|nr:MarR family transcriptional regulator [Actinocatenispora thailandica]BCJ37751.1 MarR family transcriptional regulator [Actinocatenispora thailandica]
MGEDALADELRQAIGQLVRAVRSADTMPPGEAAVLGYLDRDGPQTTADLAYRRRVSHQSAAKTVQTLLGTGLVRTGPHPRDGRKLLVSITDAGRLRLRQERARRSGSLDGAIRDALDATERRQLRACVPLLDRLTATISAR